MPSKIKLFLPLILVELYLLFTIFLLYFGPIIWPIENESKFLILIAFYHISLIAGYFIGIRLFLKKCFDQSLALDSKMWLEEVFIKWYWIILILAFIGAMISHRNITHTSSYIPWDFFTSFYKGIVDPAAVRGYYASKEYLLSFTGNKYVTSLLLCLSIFKYMLLPALVYLWPRLSLTRRIFGCLVLAIPVISGVSISLSSINFSYLFVIGFCFLVIGLSTKFSEVWAEFKKRNLFLYLFVFLFLFSFWQFYSVKSGVSPYQVIVGKQVPTSFNYLEKSKVKFKSTKSGNKGSERKSIFNDFHEKLTTYLVQGYVGMSIAIGEKFESSYGFGHSVFLQRAVDKHLGIPIVERSFQRKITDRWDENVFWHSAYSHFANDVGFFGVCGVMFLLGFYFAISFALAVVRGDLVCKLLLPLFGIMFLYFPANNQIFSFLETMSSFWILTSLLVITVLRKKWHGVCQ